MKLLKLTILASLLAIHPTIGQEKPATPAPTKKAMFWKASSKDNVVYLLGSIHAGTKEMYPLPKEIEDAYAQASTLAVEVDSTKEEEAKEKFQAFVMKGMYQGDDSLWDHIDEQAKKQMEKTCELLTIPCGPLSKMKPWLLSLVLPVMAMQKSGLDPKYGIDKHFLELAAKTPETKKVLEIEGIEFQLKLLSSFEDKLQVDSLTSALGQMDKMEAIFKTMRETWMSGDEKAMNDFVTAQMSGGSEVLRKAMIDDRNPAMADAAEKLLKSKERGFVMVGAGHMIGEKGIVKILAERGYKVEQVALAGK
jgi:uncharacterized protein